MTSMDYKPRNGYAFKTIQLELWDLEQELHRLRDHIFATQRDLDRSKRNEADLVEAVVMTERELRRLEAG